MKKYLFLIAFLFLGLGLTTFTGCGNSNSSNSSNSQTGINGKSYDSYREACREGDFAAAHKFLDKLKEKADDYDSRQKANEAEEYIYKQEALYLMSQNDDAAKKRLIYLIKEEERGNELVEMIIDLAIEEKDSGFVRNLANQLTGKVSDECLNKVGSFLLSNASQNNIDFTFSLFEKFEKDSLLLGVVTRNLQVGSSLSDISDKLFSILTSLDNKIPNRPALGIVMVHDPYGGSNMNKDEYLEYEKSVSRYNNGCKALLDFFIKNKKQNLAQRVVSKAKPNISYVNLGDWEKVVLHTSNSSWNYAWRFSVSNEEANSIKRAYQEAVRSGAFK